MESVAGAPTDVEMPHRHTAAQKATDASHASSFSHPARRSHIALSQIAV